MKYIFLNQKFYEEYPKDLYPEIMRKDIRPYVMVRVRINGHEFGLPLRSNIEHKHAFWTDEANKCGIDYSKAVTIPSKDYIDRKKPHIRKSEHLALRGKDYDIRSGFMKYVKQYKKALKALDVKRNHILVNYSTLQYFHKELQLDIAHEIHKIRPSYPALKHVSKETIDFIDQLNRQFKKKLSYQEIKVYHHNLGKRLEDNCTPTDLEQFKKLDAAMNDFKHAQLKEQQRQINSDGISKTINKITTELT